LSAARAAGLSVFCPANPILLRRVSVGSTSPHSPPAVAHCVKKTDDANAQAVASEGSAPVAKASAVRIGGPVKPLQPWSAIQHVDMRVGIVKKAMLPQDMPSKYKKIAQPVYAVWSDFGEVADWPHPGEWSVSTNCITAAKIRTYYSADLLNSGSVQMVGLLNAGVKQVGKLQTYYLLTGAYTDEDMDVHNVARSLPLVPVDQGARMTVLSLRADGSRYEAEPQAGHALRENLDFMQDFEAKLDLRVGAVRAVEEEEAAGALSVSVDFGDGLLLRTRMPWTLQDAIDVKSLAGKLVVGMVNVEPVDGNTFLMLGFHRGDGACVPLSVDQPQSGLPPLGARVC